MPTTEELLASLSTHSKEEIMVLAFARGASTGYKRGLGQRDRLIGELIALNYLGLSDLRVVTQMSALPSRVNLTPHRCGSSSGV